MDNVRRRKLLCTMLPLLSWPLSLAPQGCQNCLFSISSGAMKVESTITPDRKRGIVELLKSDGSCEYTLFYMVEIYNNISSKLNLNSWYIVATRRFTPCAWTILVWDYNIVIFVVADTRVWSPSGLGEGTLTVHRRVPEDSKSLIRWDTPI